MNSSAAFWGARRWSAVGRAPGHWSWERLLLVAKRTRPTVVAVTVSGGDLILVIRGAGGAFGARAGPGRAPRSRLGRRTARTGPAGRWARCARRGASGPVRGTRTAWWRR